MAVQNPSEVTRKIPLRHRIILQNFFDTQPKKRAQYLEELGFEMYHGDPNLYREKGSRGEWQEIDPSLGKYKDMKLSEIIPEAVADIADIGYDTAEGSLILSAMTGGAAAGAGIGSIPLAVGAGAGTKYISEEVKNFVANAMLDKDIPMDRRAAVVQSVVAGVMPMALKGVGKGAKFSFDAMLGKRLKDAKAAAEKFGFTDDLIKNIQEKPELLKKEVYEPAIKESEQLYKKIVGSGVVKGNRDLPEGSIFQKAMDPLNKMADEQKKLLSQIPEANFSFKDLKNVFGKKIADLEKQDTLSLDEAGALKYMKEKLSDMTSAATKRLKDQKVESLDDVNFTFGEVRDNFLKKFQSDLYNIDMRGGNIVRDVIGGGPEGLRALTDAKAKQAYDALAQRGQFIPPENQLQNINATRSDYLNTFKDFVSKIKPETLRKAYAGDETESKLILRDAIGAIDQKIGTNIQGEAEDIGVKSMIKRAMEKNYTRGSESANQELAAEMATEGLKGYGISTVMGASPQVSIPIAVAAGTMRARSRAALSSPKKAIEEVGKRTESINKFERGSDAVRRFLEQKWSTKPTAMSTNVVKAQTPNMMQYTPSYSETEWVMEGFAPQGSGVLFDEMAPASPQQDILEDAFEAPGGGVDPLEGAFE